MAEKPLKPPHSLQKSQDATQPELIRRPEDLKNEPTQDDES